MRSEVRTIGESWQGTDQTVESIYQLVDDALTDPVVVRTARSIVRNVAERDKDGESRAISAYVRGNVRYTAETVETLSAPRLMIDDIRKYGKACGDCDEMTTLWMALHKVVGIPVRAVVISQRKDRNASHIYGQAMIQGRGWVTDDTIVKSKPYGWESPARARTRTKEYGVAGLGDYEENATMQSMNFTVDGPIRKMRSDAMAPRRSLIRGRNVASCGYKLKTGGTMYVGRDGSISGVGVRPQLGLDLTSIVNFAATATKAASSAYQASQNAPKQAVPNPQQAQGGSILGMSTGTLLLVGGALFFLLKK